MKELYYLHYFIIYITVRNRALETSLWKLSAGFEPSFLETGWLALRPSVSNTVRRRRRFFSHRLTHKTCNRRLSARKSALCDPIAD